MRRYSRKLRRYQRENPDIDPLKLEEVVKMAKARELFSRGMAKTTLMKQFKISADTLKRWLEGLEPTDEERKIKAIKLYREGASLRQIVKETKSSDRTVKGWLGKLIAERAAMRKVKAIKLYREGASLRQIIKETKSSGETVKEWLENEEPYIDPRVEQAKKLYSQGFGLLEICDVVKAHHDTVKEWIKILLLEKKDARIEEAKILREQGRSIDSIAKQLHAEYHTIKSWLDIPDKIKYWTSDENEILKTYYESENWDELLPKLPGRSKNAIYTRARLKRLKKKRTRKDKAKKKKRDLKRFRNPDIDPKKLDYVARVTAAIKLYLKGNSPSEISEILNTPYRTIVCWLKPHLPDRQDRREAARNLYLSGITNFSEIARRVGYRSQTSVSEILSDLLPLPTDIPFEDRHLSERTQQRSLKKRQAEILASRGHSLEDIADKIAEPKRKLRKWLNLESKKFDKYWTVSVRKARKRDRHGTYYIRIRPSTALREEGYSEKHIAGTSNLKDVKNQANMLQKRLNERTVKGLYGLDLSDLDLPKQRGDKYWTVSIRKAKKREKQGVYYMRIRPSIALTEDKFKEKHISSKTSILSLAKAKATKLQELLDERALQGSFSLDFLEQKKLRRYNPTIDPKRLELAVKISKARELFALGWNKTKIAKNLRTSVTEINEWVEPLESEETGWQDAVDSLLNKGYLKIELAKILHKKVDCKIDVARAWFSKRLTPSYYIQKQIVNLDSDLPPKKGSDLNSGEWLAAFNSLIDKGYSRDEITIYLSSKTNKRKAGIRNQIYRGKPSLLLQKILVEFDKTASAKPWVGVVLDWESALGELLKKGYYKQEIIDELRKITDIGHVAISNVLSGKKLPDAELQHAIISLNENLRPADWVLAIDALLSKGFPIEDLAKILAEKLNVTSTTAYSWLRKERKPQRSVEAILNLSQKLSSVDTTNWEEALQSLYDKGYHKTQIAKILQKKTGFHFTHIIKLLTTLKKLPTILKLEISNLDGFLGDFKGAVNHLLAKGYKKIELAKLLCEKIECHPITARNWFGKSNPPLEIKQAIIELDDELPDWQTAIDKLLLHYSKAQLAQIMFEKMGYNKTTAWFWFDKKYVPPLDVRFEIAHMASQL